MYKAILETMRPTHWIKNIFVFTGLIFSGHVVKWSSDWISILGFVSFCFLSSTVYIFNDICDRQKDSLHPKKRNRPIASGKIPIYHAIIMIVILMSTAMTIAVKLGWNFTILCFLYLAVNIAYSTFLKNKVIIDVICIALGFVIRVLAGTAIVEVPPSSWLIICTFSISLFLGFSKRRGEMLILGEEAKKTRFVNQTYTFGILDHMISVTSSVTLVCFMLYTTATETISNIGNGYMIYTVPMVFYSLFRFSAKIREGKVDGPIEMIMSDFPFQFTITLWVITVIGIIYIF